MAARLFWVLLVCLGASGCAETGHFVAEADEALVDAEVVVQNQSDRALVLELEAATRDPQKVEVEAKGRAQATISPGVYRYQLLVSSKEPFERRWFAHGPKGKLEASAGRRYTWTYTSAELESSGGP